MRSQHQMVAFQIHLLASGRVLSLVVVAPVRADKIGRVVCHNRALVPIELIDG